MGTVKYYAWGFKESGFEIFWSDAGDNPTVWFSAIVGLNHVGGTGFMAFYVPGIRYFK